MTISAKGIRFDDATLWVDLQDGRTVGTPLAWFPRLLNAGLLEGRGDITVRHPAAAE